MAKDFKKQKAFVLLYAVLVSSIVLSIGLSLINLFTKQVILSSVGRSSQFAYYAADAGKQCAYYWYTSIYPVFGVPNGNTNSIDKPVEGGDGSYYMPPELTQNINDEIVNVIYCYKHNDPTQDARPITYERVIGSGDSELISKFDFDLNTGEQPSCAEVVVTRSLTGVDPNIQVETEIRSSGYNASCSDVQNKVNNPRRIERVVYRVDRVSPGQ